MRRTHGPGGRVQLATAIARTTTVAILGVETVVRTPPAGPAAVIIAEQTEAQARREAGGQRRAASLVGVAPSATTLGEPPFLAVLPRTATAATDAPASGVAGTVGAVRARPPSFNGAAGQEGPSGIPPHKTVAVAQVSEAPGERTAAATPRAAPLAVPPGLPRGAPRHATRAARRLLRLLEISTHARARVATPGAPAERVAKTDVRARVAATGELIKAPA